MGFLKDFFARKQDTEDEDRGGTSVIFPERVMTLILLVGSDTLELSHGEARALIFNIFNLVNPDLYTALPDKDQVAALLHETGAIQSDGHIEPDDYLDILDDLKIPNMASSYIQSLKIAEDKIAIWLRERRREDKHYDIPLNEPIVADGNSLPEDATLITVYASDVPKIVSALYPAHAKVWEPGSK
jgi:hypothetical protein